MNGNRTPGVSQGRSQFDVVGASEGPDIGTIAPDSQSFVLQALAAHLDRITKVVLANSQAPVEQVEYEVDNANLSAGGQSYKLPSGLPIIGYYVENNASAAVNFYAGSSASGRLLNTISGSSWKCGLMPQQIVSIAVVPTSTPATGLVRILLTSTPLSPAIGSTVGATAAPPSSTATVTNFTATTTAAQILAANPTRVGVQIYNNNGTSAAALGYGNSTFAQNLATYGTTGPPVNWKGSIWAFTFSGTAPLIITEFT